MSTTPVITVENASKSYWVHARTDATLLSHVADIIPFGNRRNFSRSIDAVSNISFSVEKGKVLGIIGRNGSGKTTTLQLLAGILYPDTGSVSVQGNIISLINMAVGVNHRLTVRDNIFLACSIFGMSRAEISRQYPHIIEFAEIEEYIYLYPYQLSKGMAQRLSFSIAVHSNPEVLLLDEVLTAGDEIFEKKSTKRMQDIINGRATVVLVSHQLNVIRDLCDEVIWMDKGVVRYQGSPKEAIAAYMQFCKDNISVRV